MKSDLRNLVTAQEAFFSDSQALRDRPLLDAGRRPVDRDCGWAGEATNATLKGTITKCGVYVGSGTAPNAAVKSEGAPACY